MYDVARAASGPVFGEAEETAPARELLESADEAELEQFLGKVVRSASRAVGRAVRSPVGRAIGGIAKDAGMQALSGMLKQGGGAGGPGRGMRRGAAIVAPGA